MLWCSPRVPGIATAVGLPLLTASPFLLVMLRACSAAGTLPPLGQDWAQITLLLSQMQTSAFICSLTLFPVSKIKAKSDLQCAERLGNSLMVTNDRGHPDLEMLQCAHVFCVACSSRKRHQNPELLSLNPKSLKSHRHFKHWSSR